MFIFVAYKDAPELSHFLRRTSCEYDPSVERTLLVNPNCHVRVMLEYIRKKCKLGIFTQFDLADANGSLKGLFNLPTYAYAADKFEHKKTYYLIVLTQNVEKRLSVLPQLNHENALYMDLKMKVKRFLVGELSPQTAASPSVIVTKTVTSTSGKSSRKK